MSLSPALLAAIAELARELPRNGVAAIARQVAGSTPDTPGHVIRRAAGLPLAPQAALDELLHAWRAERASATSAELAVALEAMGVYGDVVRQHTTEVVWTGPREASSGLRHTEQVLLELIGEARRSIWLVAFAAYKVPAIAAALADAAARGVKLRFVVEDHDVSGGKVSFSPLPALLTPGGVRPDVYVWPIERRPVDAQRRHGTLHAKGLVVDERTVFVTSANLTEHALNLNIELGIVTRDAEAAREILVRLEGMIGTGDLANWS